MAPRQHQPRGSENRDPCARQRAGRGQRLRGLREASTLDPGSKEGARQAAADRLSSPDVGAEIPWTRRLACRRQESRDVPEASTASRRERRRAACLTIEQLHRVMRPTRRSIVGADDARVIGVRGPGIRARRRRALSAAPDHALRPLPRWRCDRIPDRRRPCRRSRASPSRRTEPSRRHPSLQRDFRGMTLSSVRWRACRTQKTDPLA